MNLNRYPVYPSHYAHPTQPDLDILDGISPTFIKYLEAPQQFVSRDVEVKNVEYVASYNWVDTDYHDGKAMIIVPGSPPVWKDKQMPYQVSRDIDSQRKAPVDPHAHYIPNMPMLPMFRAADFLTSRGQTRGILWKEVDFVTERNSLRKLLRFIDGKYNMGWEFRMDTQLLGVRTILLQRWQESSRQDVYPYSYGTNFEKEITQAADGCEGSGSHFRAIKYDFNGLTMVVRYEVDAYCMSEDVQENAQKNAQATMVTRRHDDLDINAGGSIAPQESLMELKSFKDTSRYGLNMDDIFPQLYLSQVPTCLVGLHRGGVFTNQILLGQDSPSMVQAKRAAEARLGKLGALLHIIREAVLEHGVGARLSLVLQEGVLTVRKRQSQQSFLPDDVIARFNM
ncbi:hypothetical protein K474DRAFT_1713391 [Panus rudis PR-1116 ss-1]|nr:hypothetical protein K474DRAFT_1713391 [Panus rudis PR-1116 ss-1]